MEEGERRGRGSLKTGGRRVEGGEGVISTLIWATVKGQLMTHKVLEMCEGELRGVVEAK